MPQQMAEKAEGWQRQTGAKYHVQKGKTSQLSFRHNNSMEESSTATGQHVVLNDTICCSTNEKKYLGVLVDTTLKYQSNFDSVMNKVLHAGLQLAILACAGEIPWFSFIKLLQSRVLSKAFYHCLHIIMIHGWENRLDDILLQILTRALDVPSWRVGPRLYATLFGGWRWSTCIKQAVVRKIAYLDSMQPRATKSLWSLAKEIPGTIAHRAIQERASLGVPSMAQWLSFHQIETSEDQTRSQIKQYMTLVNTTLQQKENDWRDSIYRNGSLLDLWDPSNVLSRHASQNNLSWTTQFALRNWLRFRLAATLPTKSGVCVLCQQVVKKSWEHILSDCPCSTELIQRHLNKTSMPFQSIQNAACNIVDQDVIICTSAIVNMLKRQSPIQFRKA